MSAKAWLVCSDKRTVAVNADGTLALVSPPTDKASSAVILPPHIVGGLTHAPSVVVDSVTEDNTAVHFLPYRTLLQTHDLGTLYALSFAFQWLDFKKVYRFCHRCGSCLGDNPSRCTGCHLRHYPPISPCVIAAVTRRMQGTTQLLLARHHRHKNGMFGLIAGFMEAGESAELTVAREVAEEVGLQVTNIRYVASEPYPYPSNLMLGFVADYQEGVISCQTDEIAEAGFFGKDNLPPIPPKGTIAHRLIMHALDIER